MDWMDEMVLEKKRRLHVRLAARGRGLAAVDVCCRLDALMFVMVRGLLSSIVTLQSMRLVLIGTCIAQPDCHMLSIRHPLQWQWQ